MADFRKGWPCATEFISPGEEGSFNEHPSSLGQAGPITRPRLGKLNSKAWPKNQVEIEIPHSCLPSLFWGKPENMDIFRWPTRGH